MGIRESLKEQPDELKLQNFVIEDEPEEKNKDFKTAIFEKINSKIQKNLDKIITRIEKALSEEKLNIEIVGPELALLKIIFPDQEERFKKIYNKYLSPEEFNEKIKEIKKTHQNCIEALVQADDEKFQSDYFYLTCLLDAAKDYQILFSTNFEQNIKTEILQAISYIVTGDFGNKLEDLSFATFYKILLPDQNPAANLNLDKDEYIELLKEAIKFQHFFPEIIPALANFKILFPDCYDKLEIDDSYFKKIEKEIQQLEKNVDQAKYFRAICALKIHIAKEIKITDHGFELIMPEKKSFQPQEKKRPERRNF